MILEIPSVLKIKIFTSRVSALVIHALRAFWIFLLYERCIPSILAVSLVKSIFCKKTRLPLGPFQDS